MYVRYNGMAFNQRKYISNYNKETYKMFPFRVRRDNGIVINKLYNTRNKNKYITDLIEKDVNPSVLTLKQIKERIMPILLKHNIREIYLFGSYARGEARNDSDIDIFCEKGDVDSLIKHSSLINELQESLGKKVDVVFISATMDEFFEEQIRKDLIKLC